MTCQWFSPGAPVSSTNKIDRHDITEMLLIAALSTISLSYQTKEKTTMGKIFNYKWTN